MAVVAEFEIHIEMKLVTHTKPKCNLKKYYFNQIREALTIFFHSKTYLRGLQPTSSMVFKAKRLCRLQYSMAEATIKLPRNMAKVSLK